MKTIKKNKHFRYIYSVEKSIADSLLVIYKHKTEQDNRYGISVSSKVGKAVVRNKLKRQIKEILRLNSEQIITGYDIIFIVRVRASRATFNELKTSVYYLLKKSDLLVDGTSVW